MPKDYSLQQTPANEMRRPHLACDDAWIVQFLSRVKFGHLATHWDEQPFITPTNFWYDPQHHEIYMHTNLTGRLHANAGRHPQVCFEATEAGETLPSNVALEFAQQFESVVVFGAIRVLEEDEDRRRALYGLISRYFPEMQPGVEYRPISDQELKRTAVYAISIQSWSGKRNWPDQAVQSPDWPPPGSQPAG
jgi:nitroimidazol reductase NimA-like FMN-containing flavoprotein (pyridoxamine 5'-phosphate oxidase superfamily)